MASEDYSAEEDSEDPYAATKKDRKRRFSEAQIKSLESVFESQAKLEPKKKLQVARDLGLHPRQVAIWFQNKRARWKSKQLEHEYATLRHDYDALLSSFDSLKGENQQLLKQLQKLESMVKQAPPKGKGEEEKMLRVEEGSDLLTVGVCSDDEEKKLMYMGGREEVDLLYLAEQGINGRGYLASPIDGGCSPVSTSHPWWETWALTE